MKLTGTTGRVKVYKMTQTRALCIHRKWSRRKLPLFRTTLHFHHLFPGMSSGMQCAEMDDSAKRSGLSQLYARVQKLDKAGIVTASRIKIEKPDKPSNSSAASSSSAASPVVAAVDNAIDLLDSPEPETKANAQSDTIVID